MLRSLFHLSEVLKTRPDSNLPSPEPTLPSQHKWSPKKKLKPGQVHWIATVKWKTTRSFPDSETTSTAEAETAEAKFQYERQLSQEDVPAVIRLLRVSPGRREDPIVVALQYVSTEQPPSYEAISYCWGNQPPTVSIDCDGQSLKITKNLSDAIKSVRREDTSLLIWADALCINQSSVEEKNSQVPLMRQIYQKAAVVQVWLGEDTPERSGQEGFNLLRELRCAYDELDWDFDIFKEPDVGASPSSCQLPALDDSSWRSLNALVQRPWFARAWIIQEVVVSQKAVLRCGRETLPWDDFYLGFLFAVNTGFLYFQANVLEQSLAYQQLVPLIVTYRCFTETKTTRLDLASLLESHRNVGATDPKDKVYALLGLSTGIGEQSYQITPDYSQETASVYTEIAKAILSTQNTLDLLGVPRAALHSSIGELPSWVPDWSINHLANSLSFQDLEGKYVFDFHAASKDVAKQVEFRGRSLILNGHVFDTIVTVGKVMDPFNSFVNREDGNTGPGTISSLLHADSVLHEWRILLRKCCSSSTIYAAESENLLALFGRIIFFDVMPQGSDLARMIRTYETWTYRASSSFWYHISQLPGTLRALNWYEKQLGVRHIYMAMIKGREGGRATGAAAMLARVVKKRLVVTSKGYVGLSSEFAEAGDCVTIVKGGRVPLVMRPKDQGKWELIGDSYVHGIMHGEGFEVKRCEGMEVL